MKITLEIKDNRLESFIELIKTLDYVSISKEVEDIPQWQQSEVSNRLNLIKIGKMKTSNWNEAKRNLFEK